MVETMGELVAVLDGLWAGSLVGDGQTVETVALGGGRRNTPDAIQIVVHRPGGDIVCYHLARRRLSLRKHSTMVRLQNWRQSNTVT
jgi:hypothetical protein